MGGDDELENGVDKPGDELDGDAWLGIVGESEFWLLLLVVVLLFKMLLIALLAVGTDDEDEEEDDEEDEEAEETDDGRSVLLLSLSGEFRQVCIKAFPASDIIIGCNFLVAKV